MTAILSKCTECRHFHKKESSGQEFPDTCDAFPKRIPWWLLFGGNYKCTDTISFEPLLEWADLYENYNVKENPHPGWPCGSITIGLTNEEITELQKTMELRIWKE